MQHRHILITTVLGLLFAAPLAPATSITKGQPVAPFTPQMRSWRIKH